MLKPDKEHAVSFTGHRPERLDMPEKNVCEWLETQIRKAISDGYTDFISGMQRGVDLWAAEIVIKIKKELKSKGIRLFSAVAFQGMEKRWENEWQNRYYTVLKEADETVYVCEKPGRVAFFRRNEWMVDNSNRLIAVYTGAPGGTKETIIYAKRRSKEVITISE